MNATLNEQDLRKNPSTRSLPVFDIEDWRAKSCLSEECVCEYAEAADAMRLCELLHRREYQPVAVVRDRSQYTDSFRVYFRQLHSTEFSSSDNQQRKHAERPNRKPPR